MPLEDYRNKRDFRRTPEPPGDEGATRRRFVVQKHAARRLHYDLRLEWAGVLVSWAVPKGPSLDPTEKRLAVQTEDHPLAYGEFEGIIPEGEYGGGTVLLWDEGFWTPNEDPDAFLSEGRLKFSLHGRKLTGGWTLVRIKNDPAGRGRNWLLIKERDAAARPEDQYCVTDELPFSVLTNRSMREIASAKDRIWDVAQRSEQSAPSALPARVFDRASSLETEIRAHPGARRAAQPSRVTPPKPRPKTTPPTEDDWLHEIRLEGRRLQAFVKPEEVVLRAGTQELTRSLPEIARTAGTLPIQQCVLDGVIVVTDVSGRAQAGLLADALASNRSTTVQLFAFDLPFAAGFDLRKVPIGVRKQWLQTLLVRSQDRTGPIQFSDHIVGRGDVVLQQARQLGVAGIISKRADGGYNARTAQWFEVRTPTAPDSSDAESTELPNTNREDKTVATPPAVGAETARRTTARPGVVTGRGLTIAGVRLSNPQRILYPEDRVTKRALAQYYERVADWALPHVIGRPLSLYRCPKGHEQECFFQKHLGETALPHLREAPLRAQEQKLPYIVIDDLGGLITLAQLSTLEIHPWGCREDDIERPDRLVFDLDPGTDITWRQIVEAARTLRDLLADLGLVSFVKTSGGKGLHIVVPMVRRSSWEQAKAFTAAVVREMVRREPQRYVATISKWARTGRIFVDYLRNVRGATCVSAYSTRARPGAAVSTPLHWEELDPHPTVYTIQSVPRRLASLRHDPWDGFFEQRQSITKPMWQALGVRNVPKP